MELIQLSDIPSELVEKILGFLPLDQSLLAASEVCTTWARIIRDPLFWKHYYSSSSLTLKLFHSVRAHVGLRPDEWAVHWAVLKYNVFNSNLLKNVYGEEGFSHWRILSGEPNSTVPSGWSILTSIQDTSFPPNLGAKSCFATDQHSCSMEQTVDLWAHGFTPAVMRACVPFEIHWGVWVSTPPEFGGGFYDLHLRFLSATTEEILLTPQTADCPSLTQSHTLPPSLPFTKLGGSYCIKTGKEEYEIIKKNKLRYVHLYHGGMARGNESGGVGPRLYCPEIRVILKSLN